MKIRLLLLLLLTSGLLLMTRSIFVDDHSFCPSYGCDLYSELPRGACAAVVKHGQLTSVIFSDKGCPAGMTCEFGKLLNLTLDVHQVSCVASSNARVFKTEEEEIILRTFGITHAQNLPGETCSLNIDCWSQRCVTNMSSGDRICQGQNEYE
jgi:hypothetical protein